MPITILTGAGSSFAVNPEKYPTTVGYYERFSKEIDPTHYLFNDIKGFFPENTDVECVIWKLRQLKEFYENYLALIHDEQRLAGYLNKQKARPINLESFDKNYLQKHRDLLTNAGELISRLENKLFEIYHVPPTSIEIQDNWLYLLGMLLGQAPVEIFTLNYDLVIEEVFENLNKTNAGYEYFDGRPSSRTSTKMDFSFWQSSQYETRKQDYFALTKLHGSVDWRVINGECYYGQPTPKGRTSEHLLLPPGLDKVPSTEPFLSFHQYFRKSLASANTLIIIGYAFRDLEVNKVLNTAPKDCAIYIIDYASKEEDERKFTHRLDVYNMFENRTIHTIFAGFGKEGINLLRDKLER